MSSRLRSRIVGERYAVVILRPHERVEASNNTLHIAQTMNNHSHKTGIECDWLGRVMEVVGVCTKAHDNGT